jgi:CO dehydrogenase/acetyl-CoA synthase beta subunit
MKQKIFAVLAGAAIVATGCVQTVSDTHTFAISATRDMVSNRFDRPFAEVYKAACAVLKNDGVIVTEYVSHEYTNSVQSVEGRVNNHKVWIRVGVIDTKITQVDVQARTKAGLTDIDLAHQLGTEVALELAAH